MQLSKLSYDLFSNTDQLISFTSINPITSFWQLCEMEEQRLGPDLARLRHDLQSLSVPSLFPDSPDFDKHAQSYNRVFSYKPAAICVPRTDEDISNAIRCAHAHGLKVQPKSGGHSYGAFSSGGQDGGMIIHLKNFTSVQLDTNTNVAVVGAGARLGRLASELFRQGKAAVPHGTIKNVGVGGHFSHGGYGYQSRAWGLGLDRICGLDVVLADGRRVHVTAEGQPELWFALRGSADSFGIITRFHLQTVPAPERVVLFSFEIAGIVENVEEATSTFLQIQSVVQDSEKVDRKLSFGFYIHQKSWTIWGVYLGDKDHFESHIASALLHGIKRPVKKLVQSMEWLECLEWFSESHSNDASEEAFDTFYAQSVLIPENEPLSEEVAYNYFDCMRSLQLESSQSWYAVINLHGGPDSQITSIPSDASSYTHRHSLWVMQHYGYATNHLPPLLDSTKAAVNDLTQTIRKAYPAAQLGAEANYQDPDMDRDMAHRLHHGEVAVARLEALKAEVDPGEVFWNPQSIRPAVTRS
ncbi:hypothetical protein N0V93_009682 [Gnomoniopsis smithogilvyi]|uniref:FAD-binding PCMH-type domain-containing protein n=1 Tax=Gnomoniopsis smithogilvyi TaxID=1191159 RepID=A0A9W8YLA0_9PEZI|nr:hypothetical protein N0V93_009682 [Gnomoniopsis smithogilvyi]